MVCADGTLKTSQNEAGSIHSLGAKLQEQESCNGWTFWHIERDGKIIAIDDLRADLRAENYAN